MNTHPVLHAENSGFPRGPLLAVGLLVLAVVVLVSAVRLSGMPISTPDAPAALTRSLRFEDRPDGSIVVIDAVQGRVVHTIVGQAGFIRGTLRGLARQRRLEGIGPERPFELIGRADGRLTLVDPATNRRVDLESFGPTNSAEFARLLQAGAH
jgi:putative photosynthetic complex assembly protein